MRYLDLTPIPSPPRLLQKCRANSKFCLPRAPPSLSSSHKRTGTFEIIYDAGIFEIESLAQTGAIGAIFLPITIIDALEAMGVTYLLSQSALALTLLMLSEDTYKWN